MGRLLRAVALLLGCMLGAVACSGGGDELDLQLAASIDPCAVLGPDEATALVGAEVRPGASLGATIGCAYELDAGGGSGSAIAASLALTRAEDDDPAAALTKAADAAAEEAGESATVADKTLSVQLPGPGGGTPTEVEAKVVATGTEVRIVYVVETVVVTVFVAPAGGEVNDVVTNQVVDFTSTTVEPVRRAVIPSDVTAEDVEGTWAGDWGTITIQIDDGEVRAAYLHDQGTITGTFENGVIVGWWTELPSREPDSDAGEVEFRFVRTDEGVFLDGRWRYGTTGVFSENWDLALAETEAPPELLDLLEDDDAFVEQP